MACRPAFDPDVAWFLLLLSSEAEKLIFRPEKKGRRTLWIITFLKLLSKWDIRKLGLKLP